MQSCRLVPPEGYTGPVFLVQGVPEPKQTKNRMHLDLHVSDPDAEAARLVGLGATRTGGGSLGDITWITIAIGKATSSTSASVRTLSEPRVEGALLTRLQLAFGDTWSVSLDDSGRYGELHRFELTTDHVEDRAIHP